MSNLDCMNCEYLASCLQYRSSHPGFNGCYLDDDAVNYDNLIRQMRTRRVFTPFPRFLGLRARPDLLHQPHYVLPADVVKEINESIREIDAHHLKLLGVGRVRHSKRS